MSQSRLSFPGVLNVVFYLSYSSSVPASCAHPLLPPSHTLPLCFCSRPWLCHKAQSWAFTQLTTEWLCLHAEGTQSTSLALIFQPPQRPEFQLLLEHLPLQFWEYHVFPPPDIWANYFLSARALPAPYSIPVPQMGIQKPSQSLFWRMSLPCRFLSIPCASIVIELTTVSCNCVLDYHSPHTELKTPPGLGLSSFINVTPTSLLVLGI